jgi:nitrous oxidase accessory protein
MGLRLRSSTAGALLAIYAAVLLAAAVALPWWRMENRAPQYGMRVLWVNVSPLGVAGDIKEIDGLGHYVGMRAIAELAQLERVLAPWALAVAVLCALALPFLRQGRLRLLLGLAVAAVPAGFVADLWYWQEYAVTHLDPHAALNKIADRVQARLVGSYSVAQFRVEASFQSGFWLTVVAAANALGFLWSERRRRDRTAPSAATAAAPRRPSVPMAVTLAGAVLLLAPAVPAETLEVGPLARHRSIGAALLAAAPGDTVLVRAGTYAERLVIDRPLTLMGEAGVVVDGGGTGTVVLVQKGPTVVRGLVLHGSGSSLVEEDAGIKIVATPDCEVADCRVSDALFGIMVRSGARARLRRCHVTGKDLPAPRQGDGIRLQDAPDSIVEDCVVERSRDFAIWQSNGCLARRNQVRGCRYGLHYMYCDDNVFDDNVFADNQTGGAIMYSRRLTLRRNRFSGARGPSAYGLLIKVGDDVLAERNWFVDNTRGVFLEDSPSARAATCTLRDNVIAGNDAGISLQASVARVLFTGNALVANRVQVEVLGTVRREANTWSEGGRGNYWSDYVGFDADGDGIGDTPHCVEQFFEDLAERWPGAGLLRLGPAAQALESAARAFPIVKARPAATDPSPLAAPPAALMAAGGARVDPAMTAGGAIACLLALLWLWRCRHAGLELSR